MNLVFDTSFLSAFLDEDESAIRVLDSLAYLSLSVPLATDAELRFGYANGNRQKENLEKYQDFINHFNAKVISPDQKTSVLYAELATYCRQKEFGLSNNDLWIAATCIQAGGKLLTLDKDFTQLPQVRLVKI